MRTQNKRPNSTKSYSLNTSGSKNHANSSYSKIPHSNTTTKNSHQPKPSSNIRNHRSRSVPNAPHRNTFNLSNIHQTSIFKNSPDDIDLNPPNKPILRTKNQAPDTKTQEGRKKIAKETMEIMYGEKMGKYFAYEHGKHKPVDISNKINNCVNRTETISETKYNNWTPPITIEPKCKIEVRSETTFGAAKRLAPLYKTCVLNFASATKPGGGFKNGKTAQEESLSRTSALYKSLKKDTFMYTYHQIKKYDFVYTDYMIYSPSVPVFRDDITEKLLPEKDVFCTDVITSAAPNKAEMVKHHQDTSCLHQVIYKRCEKILRCAISHDIKALVLGAFGCGVFGNSPKEVSQIFKELLIKKKYNKYFKTVVFAITGINSENYREFSRTFSGL